MKFGFQLVALDFFCSQLKTQGFFGLAGAFEVLSALISKFFQVAFLLLRLIFKLGDVIFKLSILVLVYFDFLLQFLKALASLLHNLS